MGYYLDDGYSGTNFNRPSFQNMIDAVRRQEIQCIMVKDFSRFARNYLDMGEYLEQIFPFLGVRFISVNDHYDSQNGEAAAGDWNVVFKNFLYDLYSKDLSKKVTSSKMAKARNGEYLGRAPIGYVRSKTDKNRLEIEPEGAEVVRKIFDYALEGKKIPQITKLLNSANIPTPNQFAQKASGRKIGYKSDHTICWSYGAVHRIIQNPVYTGACVNFKRSVVAPCAVQTKTNDKKDWIIVPGCHEAIISEEEFERVQQGCNTMIESKNIKMRTPIKENIFRGFLVCGYCNHKMRYDRRKNSSGLYSCWTTAHANIPISDQVCDTRKYPADDLKRVVLNAICEVGKLAKEKLNLYAAQGSETAGIGESTRIQIASLEQQIMRQKNKKKNAYEQYVSGMIDKKEFIIIKGEADQIINSLSQKLKEQKDKLEAIREPDADEKIFCSKISEYAAATELTRPMVETLIDQIVVYRDRRIEIKWQFKDFFIDQETG